MTILTSGRLAATACALALAACGGADSDNRTADAGATVGDVEAPVLDAFALEPVAGANYGAGVPADATGMSYEAFAAQLAASDSLTGVVRGRVVDVCQKKGCWMTLAPVADAEVDDPMSVRFLDYGFFMPKTLSGSEVLVEGTARRRTVPVGELRHYAEDAGKSAEEIAAITEPGEEVEFMATGVRVL